MDTEILAKLLRRNEVLTKAHSQETLGTWACANRTVCDPLELGAAELPDSAVTFDGADHGVAETPARNCELAPGISPTPTRDGAHFIQQAPLIPFPCPRVCVGKLPGDFVFRSH